ncbi:MAG: glycosyltransferase [Pseudomonadota bacterium]|nr:glycosyltransferase [Pseudomonadota bacterium]
MALAAALSLGVWLYLIFARGGFWLASEREAGAPAPAVWPDVVAVIPARDEAATIAATLGSLLHQDYPGRLLIVLVDDESRDGTTAAAAALGDLRLEIVAGAPTPPGWTGKLWAVAQGIARAGDDARYLLLSDADIAYRADALAGLVARAEAERLVLNSLMARLRCDSFPERFAIPAFVFFFQMLYPFAWVHDARKATAAAAGGCMLVRRDALAAAGGVAAIRGALIDDCALARLLKPRGAIRLSLASQVTSLRRYPDFGEIRRMVVRSAYAQLSYSPALLAFTVAAMALVFVAAPLAALFGHGAARACGLGAWALMATAMQPTLRDYRVSPLWGFALPAIAALYTLYTVESGLASARGRGGLWKGRYQERGARSR